LETSVLKQSPDDLAQLAANDLKGASLLKKTVNNERRCKARKKGPIKKGDSQIITRGRGWRELMVGQPGGLETRSQRGDYTSNKKKSSHSAKPFFPQHLNEKRPPPETLPIAPQRKGAHPDKKKKERSAMTLRETKGEKTIKKPGRRKSRRKDQKAQRKGYCRLKIRQCEKEGDNREDRGERTPVNARKRKDKDQTAALWGLKTRRGRESSRGSTT